MSNVRVWLVAPCCLVLVACLAAGVAVAGRTGAASADGPEPVHAESVLNNFADWSWGTHALSQTAIVHTPPDAMSFQASGWQGLNFVAPEPLLGAQYKALDFWIYGAAPGGQTLLAYFTLSGDTSSRSVRVESYAPGGRLPASAWTRITIPLADLGVQATTAFTAIVLQAGTGDTQATVYIDDLALILDASAAPSNDGGTGDAADTSTTGSAQTTTGGTGSAGSVTGTPGDAPTSSGSTVTGTPGGAATASTGGATGLGTGTGGAATASTGGATGTETGGAATAGTRGSSPGIDPTRPPTRRPPLPSWAQIAPWHGPARLAAAQR